jgi:hypothetical protein
VGDGCEISQNVHDHPSYDFKILHLGDLYCMYVLSMMSIVILVD